MLNKTSNRVPERGLSGSECFNHNCEHPQSKLSGRANTYNSKSSGVGRHRRIAGACWVLVQQSQMGAPGLREGPHLRGLGRAREEDNRLLTSAQINKSTSAPLSAPPPHHGGYICTQINGQKKAGGGELCQVVQRPSARLLGQRKVGISVDGRSPVFTQEDLEEAFLGVGDTGPLLQHAGWLEVGEWPGTK